MGTAKQIQRLLLFVSFLSFDCVSVNGQVNAIYPHLTVSSFNDNWGGGFTKIKDDQRSFGFELDYQFYVAESKVMQTRLRYSGLTNRFVRPDSTRLDELELFLRYPVFTNDHLIVSAIGGGYLIGDLGGDEIQNTFHYSTGVAEINLPYSIENQVYGMLGSSIWFMKKLDELLTLNSTSPQIEAEAEYLIAPNYMQRILVRGGFALANGIKGDKVSVSAGYSGYDVFLNESTLQSVGNTETGFFIRYGMRLGIANFGFTTYPGNSFTLGTFGISLLTGKADDAPLEVVDATVEFGALLDGGFYIRHLGNHFSQKRNNDYHFTSDFMYQYWTLGGDDLPNYPAQFGHYQQFSLGVNYQLFTIKRKFQLLPYASTRLGYTIEHVYAGSEPSKDYQVGSFNVILEGGLRLKLPVLAFDKNCYYGLTANYQYAISLSAKNDYPTEPRYAFAQNKSGIAVGGFVMIDF